MTFRLEAGQHSHEEFHSELYIPLRKVSEDLGFQSLASSEFPGQQDHGSHVQYLLTCIYGLTFMRMNSNLALLAFLVEIDTFPV